MVLHDGELVNLGALMAPSEVETTVVKPSEAAALRRPNKYNKKDKALQRSARTLRQLKAQKRAAEIAHDNDNWFESMMLKTEHPDMSPRKPTRSSAMSSINRGVTSPSIVQV